MGLSLTMPLKVEAARHADFLEPLAKAVGAVNTILVEPKRAGGHLVGANTDVPGIVAALAEAGVATANRAVILGAGATATSAMAALASIGCHEPTVIARDRSRAGVLLRAAARLGTEPKLASFDGAVRAVETADVVVSTIPAAAGATVAAGLGGSALGGVLLDAVYDPRPTPLTDAWLAAGGAAIDGTRMLLHQAAEQVRLFTGMAAPLAAMDSALLSHLSH